ncbi:hypothetical protein L226DRAFT_69014 [Lentinus tigrinus ALCF2SS1-7]|uniref:uncharacterized protein n=1 Tax=Lentinus tigrinus ALCF2SS1-7 TaxID=1328758 RepID=UPI001165FBC8|nr:hypothetical protein L226DRAFT_69014 [Lentinus tigrinus ALCF2SS1-7]
MPGPCHRCARAVSNRYAGRVIPSPCASRDTCSKNTRRGLARSTRTGSTAPSTARRYQCDETRRSPLSLFHPVLPSTFVLSVPLRDSQLAGIGGPPRSTSGRNYRVASCRRHADALCKGRRGCGEAQTFAITFGRTIRKRVGNGATTIVQSTDKRCHTYNRSVFAS